ncbi:MAG: adenylate/guanylate cyclase domain-containing protein [Deltaproteobacteria bacterium]|nr:adenylate/guanylate cyclase domain-containing protein [Deltaproteobacteria bacterium]
MSEGLTLDAEFEGILARLVLQLERGVATVTVATSFVCFCAVMVAHALGARMGVAITWITLVFCGFYAAELVLLKLGLYTKSMRWVSALVDVTLATSIILFDVSEYGAVCALTGVGTMLYLLAVAASTLRLAPNLCVMAGAVGALQFVVVSVLVIIPATTPVERDLMASAGFVVGIKAILILAGGVFAALATHSMRRLLRRITWSAVERDRARGLFGQSASDSIMNQLLVRGEENTRRAVTIVSVEIRGFSQLAQTRAPPEVVLLLNTFFEKTHAVVAARGGVVNKVFGSGMLCVFMPDASGAQQDDAWRALAAASEMSVVAGGLGLKLGAGLHRGETLVASIGGVQRQELSFVGETVTIAVGMQELTRRLGPAVFFTQAVRERVPSGESAGWFEVRGSVSLVEAFTAKIAPT